MVSPSTPTSPPNQATIPFRNAMNASTATRVAPTLATRKTAVTAPSLAASRMLAAVGGSDLMSSGRVLAYLI